MEIFAGRTAVYRLKPPLLIGLALLLIASNASAHSCHPLKERFFAECSNFVCGNLPVVWVFEGAFFAYTGLRALFA